MRGLGRADVHAAVDRHRVDAEDLAAQLRATSMAKAGLARGRRAEDHQHELVLTAICHVCNDCQNCSLIDIARQAPCFA